MAGIRGKVMTNFREAPESGNHYQGHHRLCKCGGEDDCVHCGGTGVRRVCHQRDCQEFGCTFGHCYVPPEEAAAYRRWFKRAR